MRLRILIFLIVFIVGMSVSAWSFDNSRKGSLTSQFVLANEHYKKGEYAEASREYEEIIKGGWESGSIYFNLGNAYLKQKKIGKAILNYERAKRINPRDSDLRFNMNYAYGLLLPSSSLDNKSLINKLIDGHLTFYCRGEMIAILTLIFFVWGVFVLISLNFSWPQRLRSNVSVVLAVIFTMYAYGLLLKVKSEIDQVVVIENVDAKFEPKIDATTYYKVLEGEKVKLITEDKNGSDGWVKVQRPDGKLGWVPGGSVERI